MSDNDEFWGNTPDWTDTSRPGSASASGKRSGRSSDRPAGSKWKKLWGSAMSAGTDGTREHRIVNAADGAASLDDTSPIADDDLWPDDEWPTSVASVEVETTATGAPDDSFEYDFTPEFAERRSDRDAPKGGVDPLLARFGAVIVVLTLLVPLVVGLRSGGSGDLLANGDVIASADAADQPASADSIVATAPVATEATYLDPSQLPPAVPVDTDPAGSADSEDLARPSIDDDTTTTDAAEDVVGADRLIATEESPAGDDGTAESADVEADAGRDDVVCAIDYEVQEGDFWIRLADAADVALADLYAVNGASSDTPLYPGTDICLPAGASTPAPPTTSAPVTAPSTTSTSNDSTTSTSTTSTTTASTTTSTTTTSSTTTPATTPATTATPATPTTVASTVPPTPVDADEVKAIIREVWPDELEEHALEIAFRESRFVPTAKNYCCYGIFQIYWSVHQSWLADLGVTSGDQLFDPETNARATLELYNRAGGWGPWTL